MRQIKLATHLTKEELYQKMRTQSGSREFKQWQILYSVASNVGMKSATLAQVLGTTQSILLRVVKHYNEYGKNFQAEFQWGGRRDETAFLTLKQEEKLIKSFGKMALQGTILTAKDIKKEVENKLKKEVSDDYIWDLFKRHNWKKKMPRPEHPKRNKAAQEEFKKNSPKYWQPNQ